MKLLLLGKNGQLGWELQRALAPLGEVVALGRHAEVAGAAGADFRHPDALAAVVRRHAPDVIVNAVAHTGVDQAEGEPELAAQVNALTPGRLAREAAALGAWLVHYSTDYVFDGSGTAPRDEDAPTGPLNTYGRTKLDGEHAIRDSGCRHLIFRTSWVYSARGGNFAKTMLRLAAERDSLKVIDDQFGAPTGAELLADITAHAVRMALADAAVAGTYHAVAAGETTWHGYAHYIIELARAHGVALRVAADRIEAVPTRAFPTPAARPHNSRLSTAKLRRVFGLSLPPWQSGVERMLTETLGERPNRRGASGPPSGRVSPSTSDE